MFYKLIDKYGQSN